MQLAFKQTALAIIAGTLAAALAPREQISPSAWAAEHLVVPDGPRAGDRIDMALTPYLCEPLDFFADACPDNKAVIRKSAQTGFTLLAIAAIGYTIDREPCRMMLVQPTDSALAEFNREKLQTAIEQTPILSQRVFPQTTRSALGSSTYTKRYPGGSLTLAIATSTADLRSKTVKKVIRDEASEYPLNLEGQGSPHDMIERRYESFLASREYKDLWISTPVIKGACAIDAEFDAGDQRYWHMDCPGCGEPFYFVFKPQETFRFDEAWPHKAHYVTECCGTIIAAHEKNALMRTGRWIATAPAPGRHRSYHFDALSSPFVPWDTIAARWLEAKDKPEKRKTFDNLTLGLAHEVKGDAPDWKRLLERREDYAMATVPARGLLLTCGVDVQHTGLWYEVVAFAANGESWSMLHGYLDGDTTDHKAGAWQLLEQVYEQQFADAFGGLRAIDAMAVDAGDGGRTNQVYNWCRARPRAFAIKGVGGWGAPAVGTAGQVDVTLGGKKIKGGATVWPIGTWSLKATYFANLNKDGVKAGAPSDPPGYCHFHEGCDERFFRQHTSEYLDTITVRGRSTRVWKEIGPNHLLDCRIYAMAMAEYLGLSRLTADQWARLAQERGVPAALQQPDLLAPDAVRIAAAQPERPPLIGRPETRRGRRVLSSGVT